MALEIVDDLVMHRKRVNWPGLLMLQGVVKEVDRSQHYRFGSASESLNMLALFRFHRMC